MENQNKLVAVAVDVNEYSNKVKNTIAFQQAVFLELNKYKVDSLEYILINKGRSSRFALSFGIKDGVARCPFSSPCGYPISLKNNLSMKNYDEALNALEIFANERGWSEICFTLPPLFYLKEEITAWINSMYRAKYTVTAVDVNYAFDLAKVYTDEYPQIIQHNARKNLRIALDSGLELIKCSNESEITDAYEVIAENRASKGYPLRMSCQQVLETIKVVDHDVFLVRKENENIAAALVYMIYPDVAQVIYWGDCPGYSELKPINFLSYNLIQYYGKKRLRFLDIGISTEDSIPNYGLCDFKESIGCERDLKLIMSKQL